MGRSRPPILEIRGLRKSFHHVEVLRGMISASRRRSSSSSWAVGIGQEHVASCCNRLEEPTGGSIRVDGIDIMAR
jgi:polar amino acid transport system ATP-binding protein